MVAVAVVRPLTWDQSLEHPAALARPMAWRRRPFIRSGQLPVDLLRASVGSTSASCSFESSRICSPASTISLPLRGHVGAQQGKRCTQGCHYPRCLFSPPRGPPELSEKATAGSKNLLGPRPDF